jgi:hypothetical protein
MENKELTETIVALIVFIFTAGILTLTAGLAGGGFESSEFKAIFAFYTPILAISVLGILLFRIGQNNAPQKFFAFIHDPEKGFFGNLKIVKSPMILAGISIFVFTIIGLIGAIKNVFFVATPQIWAMSAQQISKTSELLFGIEPAASTETALFIFITFLFLTILKLTLLKNVDFQKNKGAYIGVVLAVSLAVGLMWGSYHSIRYGSVETNFLFTVFFGFVGSLLTLATGSIIPWWVWHFANNLFYQANLMFSDDRIIIFTVLGLIIIVVPLLIYSLLKKKKKNEI